MQKSRRVSSPAFFFDIRSPVPRLPRLSASPILPHAQSCSSSNHTLILQAERPFLRADDIVLRKEAVIELLGIVLHIVEQVLSLVVEGRHRVVGIVLRTDIIKREQGVHQLAAVLGFPGLADHLAHQGGAVDVKVLAGRRRAEPVGVAPARHGLFIVLLLEILLVEGEVLDALSAVCAILALCEEVVPRQCCGNGQNGNG